MQIFAEEAIIAVEEAHAASPWQPAHMGASGGQKLSPPDPRGGGGGAYINYMLTIYDRVAQWGTPNCEGGRIPTSLNIDEWRAIATTPFL